MLCNLVHVCPQSIIKAVRAVVTPPPDAQELSLLGCSYTCFPPSTLALTCLAAAMAVAAAGAATACSTPPGPPQQQQQQQPFLPMRQPRWQEGAQEHEQQQQEEEEAGAPATPLAASAAARERQQQQTQLPAKERNDGEVPHLLQAIQQEAAALSEALAHGFGVSQYELAPDMNACIANVHALITTGSTPTAAF